MSLVYVVEIGWPYEGRAAIGVYGDIEAARAAAVGYPIGGSEEIYVTEFELNAAPAWEKAPRWEYDGEGWERVPQ